MFAKIEVNIPDLEFDKLIALWQNALVHQDRENAVKITKRVEEEWQYREVDIEEEPPWGYEINEVPDQGLLGALGYHVGMIHCQKPKLRQKILLRVVVAKLPIVHSRSYMAEWGRPTSWKRKAKLMGTIRSFIESKFNSASYSKAVKDWSSDLGSLERKYYRNIQI
jgi:hypothetical protein